LIREGGIAEAANRTRGCGHGLGFARSRRTNPARKYIRRPGRVGRPDKRYPGHAPEAGL